MQAKILFALVALGGVTTGAQAITVKATVNGQVRPDCVGAENVRFQTGASRDAMRFSYECPTEGIARTCTPAAAPGGDPHLQAGDPNFRYELGNGGTIFVTCDSGVAAVEKGTQVVGTLDGQAFDCHPALNIDPGTSVSIATIPSDQCPTGGRVGAPVAAQCVRFQCPGDTAPKACFPVANVQYVARLGEGDTALRRVSMDCETIGPMLRDSFD